MGIYQICLATFPEMDIWSLLAVLTFSSLSTACVEASLGDTRSPFIDSGVRGYFWPVVAVLARVAMATFPFHLRHHLVGYLIPRPPVCSVAADKKHFFFKKSANMTPVKQIKRQTHNGLVAIFDLFQPYAVGGWIAQISTLSFLLIKSILTTLH